jgi:hypothetical protein
MRIKTANPAAGKIPAKTFKADQPLSLALSKRP